MAAKLKALQQWCRRQCDGYRDVSITNMTSSWKSGLAFCAIIHRYYPNLINYDSLSKENVYENNKLAFEVAKGLGIPALLDAEDMVAMDVPDKLCIITYVAQYYTHFHSKTPATGEHKRRRSSIQHSAQDLKGLRSPAAKHLRVPNMQVPQPDLSILSNQSIFNNSSSSSIQVDDNDNDDVAVPPSPCYSNRRRGSVVDDVCHACHGRVYVLERHLSSTGQLYHRRCFRRDSLSSTRRGSVAASKENTIPLEQSPSYGSGANDYCTIVPTDASARVDEVERRDIDGTVRALQSPSVRPGLYVNGTGLRPLSAVIENRFSTVVADDPISKSANGADVVTSTRGNPTESSSAAAEIGSAIRSLSAALNGDWSEQMNNAVNAIHSSNNNLTGARCGVNLAELKTSSASGTCDKDERSAVPDREKVANDSSHQGLIINQTSAVSSRTTSNNHVTSSQVSIRARPTLPQGHSGADPFRRATCCSGDTPQQTDMTSRANAVGVYSDKSNASVKAREQYLPGQPTSSSEVGCLSKSSTPGQLMSSATVLKNAFSVDDLASGCSRSSPNVTSCAAVAMRSKTQESMPNRHSVYVPLSTSITATSTNRASSNVPPALGAPMHIGAEQLLMSGGVNAVASPSLVVEMRRHQARSLLSNVVFDAIGVKRQTAPAMKEITRESENGLTQIDKNITTIKPINDVTIAKDGVKHLRESETGKTSNTTSSAPSARLFSWILPNKINDSTGQRSSSSQLMSSTQVTSVPRKSVFQSSQSSEGDSLVGSKVSGNRTSLTTATQRSSNDTQSSPIKTTGSNYDVSQLQKHEKPDWQVEAERRRALRNGNYVDPEKVPAATAARKGILKGAASMESLLAPASSTPEKPVSSPDRQLNDDAATYKMSPGASATSPSKTVTACVSPGVVMRGHEQLRMTDRAVDVVQPASRRSIYVDPARQQVAAKRSPMSVSSKFTSSVDNLLMLSDKSFGSSPCRIYDDDNDAKSREEIVSKKTTDARVAKTGNEDGTAGNGCQTYSPPNKELTPATKSTDNHVEVRHVTSDRQRPHTIIIDSKQFSKKLLDSAARLAASMDDLSTKSSTTDSHKVSAESTECHLMRRTDVFASADDILCSPPSSSSKRGKSPRPISRVHAFKIVDSAEDDDTDEDANAAVVIPAAPQSADKQAQRSAERTKLIVGTEVSIQIRIPQLNRNDSGVGDSNGGSDGSVSTFDITFEPATPTDAVVTDNGLRDDRLNELDIQLNEVEMSGRMLEERIRGTGDSMADDDDEMMAQWYALVKRRNALVREESMMIYKRQQLDLEERQCEIQYQLKNLLRKPAQARTSLDKQEEKILLKELAETVAQKNAIIDSMENDRKRYLQEDQQLEAMLAAPGFAKHRRGNVLVGLRSSIRRKKSICKPASPGNGKMKTKTRLSSFFFGKKSAAPKKAARKIDLKVAEQ